MSLALLLAACGSDSGPPDTKVTDKAGRSCSISVEGEVTCDKDPKPSTACPSGYTACFQLGTTGDAAGPGAICDACCMGNTSTSQAADCSDITCKTDDDCPIEYGRCVSGQCRY